MNAKIRIVHRWASLAFTVGALLNIVAALREQPAFWLALLSVVPLIVLLLTGLYLFALPYVSRARRLANAKHPDQISACPSR